MEDDPGSQRPSHQATPASDPLATERGSNPTEYVTRSGRTVRPVQRLMDQAYFVLDYDEEYVEDYKLTDEMGDPFSFLSRSEPDTLYYTDAMKAEDASDFRKAMLDEVNSHTDREHWEFCRRQDVPEGTKVLPSVWAFKQKRRIDTRKVYKHKARLNVHGGHQKHGVNYWETYSPVVTWQSIRQCLILAILNNWHTRQIDFVLAFPQADVECDIYMELPHGIKFPGFHCKTHVLKLKKTCRTRNKPAEFGTITWYLDYSRGALFKVQLMSAFSIIKRLPCCFM